jgi:hypothetical protein
MLRLGRAGNHSDDRSASSRTTVPASNVRTAAEGAAAEAAAAVEAAVFAVVVAPQAGAADSHKMPRDSFDRRYPRSLEAFAKENMRQRSRIRRLEGQLADQRRQHEGQLADQRRQHEDQLALLENQVRLMDYRHVLTEQIRRATADQAPADEILALQLQLDVVDRFLGSPLAAVDDDEVDWLAYSATPDPSAAGSGSELVVDTTPPSGDVQGLAFVPATSAEAGSGSGLVVVAGGSDTSTPSRGVQGLAFGTTAMEETTILSTSTPPLVTMKETI